ncbi:hypothetical protein [Actinocrispum sp. NPDC049592]|uniref:hypothetical protein n=1 Tax=Actinocrispum sp. NPDC049592 TaxID=3154835 RepID=UPI003414AC03
MTAQALREAAHATTYVTLAQARRAAHGPGTRSHEIGMCLARNRTRRTTGVLNGLSSAGDDRDWMIFEQTRRVRTRGRIHSVERLDITRLAAPGKEQS